jgi:hypothetical protein
MTTIKEMFDDFLSASLTLRLISAAATITEERISPRSKSLDHVFAFMSRSFDLCPRDVDEGEGEVNEIVFSILIHAEPRGAPCAAPLIQFAT